MTCRHKKGDRDCSTQFPKLHRPIYTSSPKKEPETPDSKNYEIKEAELIKSFLVLKVLYPNCNKCSYEGNKVMVFENVTMKDALMWKEIDPHFRDPNKKDKTKAPSPIARFPASEDGWSDALSFATMKAQQLDRTL